MMGYDGRLGTIVRDHPSSVELVGARFTVTITVHQLVAYADRGYVIEPDGTIGPNRVELYVIEPTSGRRWHIDDATPWWHPTATTLEELEPWLAEQLAAIPPTETIRMVGRSCPSEVPGG